MKKETNVDLCLQKFPVFDEIPNREGWLVCQLTKHELPRTELESYVKTKKFNWAFDIHRIMEKYEEHFEMINPRLYGCKRTLKAVAKDPKDLKNHIDGKAFAKALAKYEKELAQKSIEEEAKKAEEIGENLGDIKMDDEPIEPVKVDHLEEHEENDEEKNEEKMEASNKIMPKIDKSKKRKLFNKTKKTSMNGSKGKFKKIRKD